MRILTSLIGFYVQDRKWRRVLEHLRLESARLKLQRENRELARYIDQLVKYLEDA